MKLTIKTYFIIELIFSLIVGAIFLLLLVATPVDSYNFLQDPTDYIGAHHLDTSRPYWKWDYLKGSLGILVLAVVGLIFIILGLKKPDNRMFSIAKTVVTWLTIIILIGGYYRWYLTGFDH